MRIVILGLSITSSWGNGHATTYRGLVREMVRRGHDVLFLERDTPWYARHRDLAEPPFGRTALYTSLAELRDTCQRDVRQADVVMVGSYVPDGIEAGDWVIETARGLTAFYDIDTPVTLARLERNDCPYLAPRQIPEYGLYLSFTGGPTLQRIERRYGSPLARVLYCSADPESYYPEALQPRWDLGYLGTYSEDRQPFLDCLLLEPARRWESDGFVVAGPLYPESIAWPGNVDRVAHVDPGEHRAFYSAQRFTLNLTRADMKAAGYSPSVRLFEAAACGVPIVSDWWRGLEELFEPGREILIASGPEECLDWVRRLPEGERAEIGRRGRDRILAAHTARHRAIQLERHIADAVERRTTA